ncbi:PREDICTED: DExH-box ATP-dependent RNA helicase DExH2-like isoform X2 [Camelina sativa]|uniref:RNA helicase n=1 Tax=Camelina sativa TaxID=90675 RepID=A0ABM0VL05_CAMSA|nr:PREDICTED: DExH-box ATP-dependent RNA helicase DExH2-like isoform X2 [Camelina sativa]
MVRKKKNTKHITLCATTEAWATKLLEEFRASGNDSYVFEQHLTNGERGIIHQMCRRMGLQSKSHGSGEERRLTLFKSKAGSGDGISKSESKHKYETRNQKGREGDGFSNSYSKHKYETRFQKGGAPRKKMIPQEKLKCVSFPPEAKAVLHDLFTRYPPCDGDTTGTALGIYTGNARSNWKDEFFLKPQLTKNDIKKNAASLNSRLETDKRFRQIFEARAKLPITSFRDAIISAVESNQVVLIAGETGCGKTTQVPQYLLDHMWYSKQEACKIICTQPRRISAISVSDRISWERGETIGKTVGYKVRLQSEGGRGSSVVFCTNGILLRVLIGKGVNSCVPDITHIIVDEIHERDSYSDFMLMILRDLLPSNPHLRLILMSATLDAERFSEYFGGCPVVRVPGFTHPVRTYFLEDALSVLISDKNNHLLSADSNLPSNKHDFKDEEKVALDEAIDLAWTNDEFDCLLDLISSEGSHEVYNYQNLTTGLTPLMVFAGKGRVSDVCKLLSFGANCTLKSKEGITALEVAEKENQIETAQIIREHADNIQSNSQQAQVLLDKYMATMKPEEVDVGLIVKLMKKICSDSKDGAILVFLPGWEEIRKTKEKLLENPHFADSGKFSILCLHSRVPAEEQKKVFDRPRRGCRKIVLATNIAESAVTIDDVVYVIDSGRMKEKSYDPFNDVSTLQSSWVSKANAKQRAGRAGRCQPGVCYHLYSKLREASLPEYRVPEVKRMPVDELCLQVKMLDPNCDVNDFLQKLMDPPVAQSIANALIILKDIGALTPQEELTELGQKFGQLPVHPRISKMIYFAVLVNCLDPALILACAADEKDPFIMPLLPGDRKKANAAKHELASLYGDHSDHLATVAAFQCWKNAKESGRANEFCSKYFISQIVMKRLDDLCRKLQGELKRHGVIPSSSNCSLNAHDPGILRAVIAVGLYPMLGRMCPVSKNQTRSIVETITGAKVRVPSLSNNVDMSSTKYDEALIVFDEITRGDWGVQIRSCTVLPTLPLLLFSREIAVSPTESYDADKSDDEEDHVVENVGDTMDIDKEGVRAGEKVMLAPENPVKVIVDRWLPFKVTALEIAQMYIMRERLMASILFKVKHPKENMPPHLGASMYAIACILSYDSLARSSVQTVAVQPIASVPDATSPKDDIPSANPNELQEHDPKTTPMGSKLANKLGLGNMEESVPSNLADRNEQPDPNTARVEDVSAATQQKKIQSESKRCKSPNNVDLGNIEENLGSMEVNTPSDLANGNEQKDPKSVCKLDLGREKESIPSNLAHGNEQRDPNTSQTEDASAAKQPEKKRSRSKRRKSGNDMDLGMMETSKPSDLANGNELTEPKSANNLDLGNMEENMPSDLTKDNEQTELNLPNKSNYGNMEESLPFNLANVNEQPDPSTTLMEAASSAKQPKNKRSRSKKHKSDNNLELGNIEENKPSDLANGNERKEPKLVRRLDPDKEKESIPLNLVSGNEEPDPNTAPAAKKPKRKKRKLAKNFDSGNSMEEKVPSTDGQQEQCGEKTERKSGNKSEKVSVPSNPV